MDRAELLQHFVQWCGQHIKGDEKGEAQIFLDRLFQAFEHGGVKEVGAALEERFLKRMRRDLFTSPDLPSAYPDPQSLITDDCIRLVAWHATNQDHTQHGARC